MGFATGKATFETARAEILETAARFGVEMPEAAIRLDDDEIDVDALFEVLLDRDNDPVYFDGECIEDEDAYSCLLECFVDITNGEIALEELSSEYEAGIETLTFAIDDQAYTWKCAHESDWVDMSFIEDVMALAEDHAEGRFVQNSDTDFVCVVYLPLELAETLCRHVAGASMDARG